MWRGLGPRRRTVHVLDQPQPVIARQGGPAQAETSTPTPAPTPTGDPGTFIAYDAQYHVLNIDREGETIDQGVFRATIRIDCDEAGCELSGLPIGQVDSVEIENGVGTWSFPAGPDDPPVGRAWGLIAGMRGSGDPITLTNGDEAACDVCVAAYYNCEGMGVGACNSSAIATDECDARMSKARRSSSAEPPRGC